jgi:glutaminyl-peptide cyclotransferase
LDTTSPEEADGAEILRLVEEQVALGPRAPGTEAHERCAAMLHDMLGRHASQVYAQHFMVKFHGEQVSCTNEVGIFRASRVDGPTLPPVLLGTHYDTRVRADREKNLDLRELPIPGANDGGSGTAILLHLLPRLAEAGHSRDIAVAFFDAEDMGNIDGKEFALGAAWLADHPVDGFVPAEAIVLDMVGGKGMVLDIDAHIMGHAPSRQLTSRLFRIGMDRGWKPFTGDKTNRVKYIISDHTPFALRGTAAAILIDIDYPEWHTQADLPDAMSAASLGITEAALWLYLSQLPA